MISINEFNFRNKKVIMRVDFNVPLNDKLQVTDNTRIKGALPSINKILEDGGAVILMSHLGRPKNGYEEKFSLKHVIKNLSELLNKPVKFADDCIGNSAKELASGLKPGEVLLLENLRFYNEETKGDIEFAKQLASLADTYVNDAFGTAHRAHASTTIIAQFFPNAKMFGYLINNELKSMDAVLQNPQKPFTAVLGGAKVSSKISVIENLLNKVDNLIIGGGMTYTFIAAKGGKIGHSLVEEDKKDVALKIIKEAEEKGVQLFLPVDNIIADDFSNNANTKYCEINNIDDGWLGVDIGNNTIKLFEDVLKNSKTILWNGPMGVFEMDNFAKGTIAIANALVEATKNGAFTLVGGGDSVAAINKYNLAKKVSYVSTGGGAMLEYIEGKELPGIKAVRE
ncbi:MAG: phosphoglycerate kinase [Chlorobi bacterium]|nr:phosphoglycerate kinase [Chlorobiota bacterium]